MKHLFFLLIAVSLTSCSFDKLFMLPTKFPAVPTDKEATITFRETNKLTHRVVDSTVFAVKGKTHQPAFIKHNDKLLKIGSNLESVIFKSTSGNELNGWLIKPLNPTLPLTTIFLLHGNSGNIVMDWEFIDAFVKNGFQVFAFDYSGYGFSGGKASNKNVLLDGLSALNYLKSRPEVRDSKIIIYGVSLGGHLSAAVAQKRQDIIQGLVIEAGFTSPQDIASVIIRRSPLSVFSFAAHVLVSSHFKAKKSIRKYDKPLLVIHSKEDELIPFSMGEELYKKAGSTQKELYEIKYCHGCAMDHYDAEIAAKINEMARLTVK